MSKATNRLLKSYSGIFGNQVVMKSRNGKIIMTIPGPKPRRVSSEIQADAQKKFSLAVRYARRVLEYPELLAIYKKRTPKKTPYLQALSDYMKPPVVTEINAAEYHGMKGDRISISTSEVPRVTRVAARIIDPGGKVIEQGDCRLNFPKGNYDYEATITVLVTAGITIEAEVYNLPGQVSRMAIII